MIVRRDDDRSGQASTAIAAAFVDAVDQRIDELEVAAPSGTGSGQMGARGTRRRP